MYVENHQRHYACGTLAKAKYLKCETGFPTRKSPRLPGYDYSQASSYLVTVTVDDHTERFGSVIDGEMCPNAAGVLVEQAWQRVAQRFASVELDAYIVMPNHFHAIVFVGTDVESSPPSLSRILQVFKSATTVEYGRGVKAGLYPGYRRSLWRRSYHDRIIWNEQVLGIAREYIADNPRKWHEERETMWE